MQRLFAIACLGLVAVVFGFQYAASRLGLDAGMHALDVVLMRYGISSLFLFPILASRGLGNLGGLGWGRGLGLAAVVGAPFGLLMVAALHYTSTANGAMLINGGAVLLGTFAAWYFFGERPWPARLVGVAIVISGLLLVSGASIGAGGDRWIGDLMFAIVGTAWTVYTLLLRRWRADPILAASAVSLISTVLFVPVYLWLRGTAIAAIPLDALLLQAFFQGILHSVVAMLAYAQGVRVLGAANASLSLPLVPVIGTIVAGPILGEWPTSTQWIGMALVSLGMLVANVRRRPPKPAARLEDAPAPAE